MFEIILILLSILLGGYLAIRIIRWTVTPIFSLLPVRHRWILISQFGYCLSIVVLCLFVCYSLVGPRGAVHKPLQPVYSTVAEIDWKPITQTPIAYVGSLLGLDGEDDLAQEEIFEDTDALTVGSLLENSNETLGSQLSEFGANILTNFQELSQGATSQIVAYWNDFQASDNISNSENEPASEDAISTNSIECIVQSINGLNLRSKPDVDSEIVEKLVQSTPLMAFSSYRSSDNQNEWWLYVRTISSQNEGWVSQPWTECSDEFTVLPTWSE